VLSIADSFYRNALARYQHRRYLVVVDPAEQAVGLRAVVRMVEGRFIQSIQNKASAEAGVEDGKYLTRFYFISYT